MDDDELMKKAGSFSAAASSSSSLPPASTSSEHDEPAVAAASSSSSSSAEAAVAARSTKAEAAVVRRAPATSYLIGSWLFQRGVALCLLVATLGAWLELLPLVGSEGLQPFAQFLAGVRGRIGTEKGFLTHPTVFWKVTSDAGMEIVAAVTCLAAALLTVNLADVRLALFPLPLVGGSPALLAATAWAGWLSLVTALQSFQLSTDWLLLEAAFLLVWMVPLGRGGRSNRADPVSQASNPLLVWFARLLYVRHRVVPALPRYVGAAPLHYFPTALLSMHASPTPAGWWLYGALPAAVWEQVNAAHASLSVLLPLLLLVPQRHVRRLAVVPLLVEHALLLLVANTGVLHLLQLVMLLSLFVDDACWPAWLADYLRKQSYAASWQRRCQLAKTTVYGRGDGKPSRPKLRPAGHWHLLALALVAGFLATLTFVAVHPHLPAAVRSAAPVAPEVRTFAHMLQPWHFVNAYEAQPFRARRSEINVEGSNNNQFWRTYTIVGKPGATAQPPYYSLLPYEPRLAALLWRVADDQHERAVWLKVVAQELLAHRPAVFAFIADDPFDGKTPRVLRGFFSYCVFNNVEPGVWYDMQQRTVVTQSFSNRPPTREERRTQSQAEALKHPKVETHSGDRSANIPQAKAAQKNWFDSN